MKQMCRNAIFIAMLLSIVSCKITKKAIVDYEYDGSTYEHKEIIHDTTTLFVDKVHILRDTMVIMSHDTLLVNFVSGGGTYNYTTGEMTGVTSVSKLSHGMETIGNEELSKDNSSLTQINGAESHETTRDEQVTMHEEKLSQSEYKSHWWLWFILGYASGTAMLIFLKKFKYTKWYMRWL